MTDCSGILHWETKNYYNKRWVDKEIYSLYRGRKNVHMSQCMNNKAISNCLKRLIDLQQGDPLHISTAESNADGNICWHQKLFIASEFSDDVTPRRQGPSCFCYRDNCHTLLVSTSPEHLPCERWCVWLSHALSKRQRPQPLAFSSSSLSSFFSSPFPPNRPLLVGQ